MPKSTEHRPIMAGHPPTQLQKEDADGSIIASPLHVAAALDTLEQFEGHAGSMLNARDSNGMTPLMVAAQHGSRSAVKRLLKWGAGVLEQCTQGQTSLMYSIQQQEDMALVSEILNTDRSPAHLDSKDVKGFAALHHAVMLPSPAATRSLLQAGAAVDCTDSYGATPLYQAVKKNHMSTAAILIEHKAQVDALGWDGKSLLHLASENCNPDMLRLLLAAWSSTTRECFDSILDHQENNPLHVACLHGDKRSVDLLLNAGMNVNAKGMMGWTPLHIALNTRDLELFKRLLQMSPDTSLQSKDGLTVAASLTRRTGSRYKPFKEAMKVATT